MSVWDQRGIERGTSAPLERVLRLNQRYVGIIEWRLNTAYVKPCTRKSSCRAQPATCPPTHKDIMFIADDSTCSVSLAYLGRSSVGWVLVASKITNTRSHGTSKSDVIGTWRKIYQMIAKYYPWPVNVLMNDITSTILAHGRSGKIEYMSSRSQRSEVPQIGSSQFYNRTIVRQRKYLRGIIQ